MNPNGILIEIDKNRPRIHKKNKIDIEMAAFFRSNTNKDLSTPPTPKIGAFEKRRAPPDSTTLELFTNS